LILSLLMQFFRPLRICWTIERIIWRLRTLTCTV
jgi:hypothetical protein